MGLEPSHQPVSSQGWQKGLTAELWAVDHYFNFTTTINIFYGWQEVVYFPRVGRRV
jgi:hypothetical protein